MSKIELKYPVSAGGKTIKAVTLRRLTAADLEAIQPDAAVSELTMMIKMVAAVAGLESDVVRKMDAEDFATITERLGEFIPRLPKKHRLN